eukprot:scaffold62582_cov26-Tisochrysis_lutea.AAC.1
MLHELTHLLNTACMSLHVQGPSIWERQSSSPTSRHLSTTTRPTGAPNASRIPKGPSPTQPMHPQPYTPLPVAAPSSLLPAPPH